LCLFEVDRKVQVKYKYGYPICSSCGTKGSKKDCVKENYEVDSGPKDAEWFCPYCGGKNTGKDLAKMRKCTGKWCRRMLTPSSLTLLDESKCCNNHKFVCKKIPYYKLSFMETYFPSDPKKQLPGAQDNRKTYYKYGYPICSSCGTKGSLKKDRVKDNYEE